MKKKIVPAVFAAVTALSCTAVCAFADSAENSTSGDETSLAGAQTAADTTTSETNPGSAVEAADPIDGVNPGTGAEGIAAIMGVVVVAGAALVISHKRDN